MRSFNPAPGFRRGTGSKHRPGIATTAGAPGCPDTERTGEKNYEKAGEKILAVSAALLPMLASTSGDGDKTR